MVRSESWRCVIAASSEELLPVARRIIIEWGRGSSWGKSIGSHGEEIAGRFPLDASQQTPTTETLQGLRRVSIQWQVWEVPWVWPNVGGQEQCVEGLKRAVWQGSDGFTTAVAILVVSSDAKDGRTKLLVDEARRFLAPGVRRSHDDGRVEHVPVVLVYVTGDGEGAEISASSLANDESVKPVVLEERVVYMPGAAELVAAAAARAIYRCDVARRRPPQGRGSLPAWLLPVGPVPDRPMSFAQTLSVCAAFLRSLRRHKLWLLIWLVVLSAGLLAGPLQLIVSGVDVALGAAWFGALLCAFALNFELVRRMGAFCKLLSAVHLPFFVPLGVLSVLRNLDGALSPLSFGVLVAHNVINWIGVLFDLNDAFLWCSGRDRSLFTEDALRRRGGAS